MDTLTAQVIGKKGKRAKLNAHQKNTAIKPKIQLERAKNTAISLNVINLPKPERSLRDFFMMSSKRVVPFEKMCHWNIHRD